MMNQKKFWLIVGAIGAGLAVSAGAYGAHMLDGRVLDSIYKTFKKAVRYQMYHSLALLIVGILSSQSPKRALDIAGWFFLGGIIIFSGSLYLIVFTGIQWIEWITPIGGFAFVFGWISIVYSSLKSKTVKT
ncbi:MAG: DUF423 domain-containing protein [Candidatus Thorarchaeota archaeon]